MQPLQYDLRLSAAKDFSITHAAAAARNLDAAVPPRSADTDLQSKLAQREQRREKVTWRAQLQCARRSRQIRRQSDDARARHAIDPTVLCNRTSVYPKKHHVSFRYVQILTSKSHPRSISSNAICQQWLARIATHNAKAPPFSSSRPSSTVLHSTLACSYFPLLCSTLGRNMPTVLEYLFSYCSTSCSCQVDVKVLSYLSTSDTCQLDTSLLEVHASWT